MKKILLVLSFLILSILPSHASAIRTESKALTSGGVAINGWSLGNSATLTSDSVYQSGAEAQNYKGLAVEVSGDTLTVKYQLSYDNINWFDPYTASATGIAADVTTLDSSLSTYKLLVYQTGIAPYVRYIFKNNSSAIAAVTAEALWQDWS